MKKIIFFVRKDAFSPILKKTVACLKSEKNYTVVVKRKFEKLMDGDYFFVPEGRGFSFTTLRKLFNKGGISLKEYQKKIIRYSENDTIIRFLDFAGKPLVFSDQTRILRVPKNKNGKFLWHNSWYDNNCIWNTDFSGTDTGKEALCGLLS